ncbi:hypothetical protein [Pantoea vagans]|uniref:hypothetical protein n=1 Tax=Pantoea vagans TaxID=470934 RepID=UPI00241C8688|nr:hypothetical protein [Pantoea vagans]
MINAPVLRMKVLRLSMLFSLYLRVAAQSRHHQRLANDFFVSVCPLHQHWLYRVVYALIAGHCTVHVAKLAASDKTQSTFPRHIIHLGQMPDRG